VKRPGRWVLLRPCRIWGVPHRHAVGGTILVAGITATPERSYALVVGSACRNEGSSDSWPPFACHETSNLPQCRPTFQQDGSSPEIQRDGVSADTQHDEVLSPSHALPQVQW